MYQGKIRFRGSYSDLNEAVEARKAAEKKWIQPLADEWGSINY